VPSRADKWTKGERKAIKKVCRSRVRLKQHPLAHCTWCMVCGQGTLLHTWFVRGQEYIRKSLKFQDTSVHDRLHGKPVMQYKTWTLSTYQCGLWRWPKCYHVLNWFFLPKTWFLGNLFEFSAAEITLKSISPTLWIQILPNKFD